MTGPLAQQIAQVREALGEWMRWVLPNQGEANGNHMQRAALLARLDQIGAADETRLGKEQT